VQQDPVDDTGDNVIEHHNANKDGNYHQYKAFTGGQNGGSSRLVVSSVA
jgi:hypothetical protein